ncbi:MAG: helix-turn-helix transcriptional regulator [Ruminiclostridium sp.]|nr:helix-turn-helix transcriptional regulator [Ruminiclostridium sp.]
MNGYSQRALAEKVGVNLRTLQQYEIRAKDINKAARATLLSLAKVLGCRVEDLLEYDNSEIEDNEEL